MKKRFFVLAAAMLFLLPLTALSQTANIVYIDVQRVMLESEKGKEARKTIQDEAERFKKILDSKQDELQKLKDAIEKQAIATTPEARAEKSKQFDSKRKDFERLSNDYQGELQQKGMELEQKMLKEVEEVVKTIGERDKYALIVERPMAGILYGIPSLDITTKDRSLQ